MNAQDPIIADRREEAVQALALVVGARVRAAREAKGWSRRKLAEVSDVSQRYLAQVETGQGNISLALLYRVADALDERVDGLISPETAEISGLFRAAPDPARRAALKLLAEAEPAAKGRRVALIGLRGAGKSTLGALLAKQTGARFVELNSEIEALCGMGVADLIALNGADGYRLLETEALRTIAADEGPLVLAVAGGVVESADAYGVLQTNFHTVWLKAAPEEHMARVRAQGDERPMAGNPAAMEQLRAILTARESRYAEASATLDTRSRSVDEALSALAGLVQERRFLS